MIPDAHNSSDAGSGYAAQLETLRSAAKWLLAASAAVGALLVAGLQLTGIGQLPLDSWRLYVAICSVIVTLLSIGYMIKVASTVLTQEWLTLADFTDRVGGLPSPWGRRSRAPDYSGPVEDQLTFSRHELFGHVASTLEELHRGLHECHEALWQPDLDSEARQRAAEKSSELRRTAREVVQAANYYYVLRLFTGLRVRMAWASAIAIVGIAIFAHVVDPAQNPAPLEVRIVSTHSAVP